jgi:hypothetical protein
VEDQKARGAAPGFSGNDPHDSSPGRTKSNANQSRPRGQALSFRHHRDRNMPSPRYLVKNLLPETGTGLLSGQSGTYKSFIALKLGGAVATGQPFIAGHKTKRQGATLIFLSEGVSDYPMRLEALAKAEYGGSRLPIYYVEQEVALLDPISVQDVIVTASLVNDEAMRDHKLPLTLIIFDTLIGNAGFTKSGDENDAVVGSRLMAALSEVSKASGTFTLAVDHFGKALETGTRGSSTKEAAADVVLALLANKALSGEVTACRLAVRKSKGGPSGVDYGFTVRSVDLGPDEDGEPMSSLVVDFSTAPTAPRENGAWTKSLSPLRRIVVSLLADTGETILPYADGPEVRAVRSDIVRAEFFKQYPSDGDDPKKKSAARRQAYRRAVMNARERNLLNVREVGGIEYLWLTTKEVTPSQGQATA